jgi:hypothetical protein
MDILVHDIEVLKEMFLLSIFIPDKDKWIDVEVSKNINSLYLLDKIEEEYGDFYFVGFNCLRYDGQIIEYVVRNHHKWGEASWKEICSVIYQKSQDTIDDSNYDLFPEYREEHLTFKVIDLFLIWGFFNKTKMVSLKRLAFEMDMEDIEEMPVHHSRGDLTDEEIEATKSYCHKDIKDTYQHWLYTIGKVDHPLYKGKNKIADRIVMQEEFGLSCLNYDDVKIGAEWNKLDYMALTGETNEYKLKPKKINHFFGKKYKQFFPPTAEFQGADVKTFVERMGNTFIINKKQDFTYRFRDDLIVNIGRGGIHSQEKARKIVAKEDEIYYQCDIGSQYPNAIRKYKLYPSHLEKEWNNMLTAKIERRLYYKDLAKKTKNPKYESLQEMGKLSLNGGAFGRMNTSGDWQEDPCAFLKVTIGCQLEILMIVEALILRSFNVVSVNTDGYDVLIPRSRDKEFKELCSYYENKIGNSELGNIEYTEFKWIVQLGVNDYLALKTNGEIKRKGDFTIDFELHKNKSARVIPIALGNYFVDGISIDDSIKSHTNIYDFCIRQKASKDFHYEGIDKGVTNVYNKLIRYYVSNEGEKIWKIKNSTCLSNAPSRSQVEAGLWKCFVCNKLSKDHPLDNINFDYYIEKTQKIIDNVEGRKYKIIDKNQLTLW